LKIEIKCDVKTKEEDEFQNYTEECGIISFTKDVEI
jgi:hypothetical protein